MQKCIYDLAVESVLENNMSDRIKLLNGDVRRMSDYFSSDFFDTVLCNPPYFVNNNEKMINSVDVKAMARHELTLNIDDVLIASKYLLKTGGNLAMVHRTDRFIEIIEKFRFYGLEPKKIQFIYPNSKKNSDLFLIEGVKNGKVGLKILPNMVIHNDDGSYRDNIRELFHE